MKDKKIIYFGTPDFSAKLLKVLIPEFEIIAVVTSLDAKIGRKQTLTPTPVAKLAVLHNIELYKFNKLDNLAAETLKQLNPDLFVVAAYGKIIPQELLDIPKYGALNVHPSLLPKYRGASPIQSAILAGDKKTGLTIIKMDQKMDHGPIVYQDDFDLFANDTFESICSRVFPRAGEILIDLIPEFIAGKLNLKVQDDTDATFCKIIKKEDGYFEIDNPPSEDILDRMIRAYFPWPTAWTKWNGRIVKFLPGKHIQIEGKNPTNLKNFLNGYPDFPLKN